MNLMRSTLYDTILLIHSIFINSSPIWMK